MGMGMALAKFDVEPIVREGVSERLVHHILGMVKAGNLNPGDKLPGERELAKAFDVSRPTVREAVRALSILGVLNIRHGGGIYVSPLEGADLLGPLTFFLTLRDIEVGRLYEARRLIEGEIAALAVGAATSDDIAALEALIVNQQSVVDEPIKYRALDTNFHRCLADLSGNPFLSRAAESLNLLGLEFRKTASETAEIISQSIRDHRQIVTAIRARDPAAARQAMKEHMSHVLNTTKRLERGGARA